MHRRIFFFFLTLASTLTFLVYPETIKLKNGKTVEAKIIEKTDETIKIDISGVIITYYLNEIESIDGKFIFIQKDTTSSSASASARTPKEIFADLSPAIVYIVNKTVTGEEMLGSGFIVDKDGVIVTNFHVMRGAKEVVVKLKDGKVYPVTGIIHYDPNLDTCILKINANNLPTISIGDSNTIVIGETIYNIGTPLGLEYSFSSGIVSGKRDLSNIKYLQFTAPASPGNSGGPLINPQGQAIGIVTFLIQGGQNLNFALAINEIKPFMTNQIKTTFQEFVEKVSQAGFYFVQGGDCLFGGDYNQAIENYEKAIQIDPNYVEAYNNLGYSYRSIGKYKQAITYYQKAIQIKPNFIPAYANLGALYNQLNEYQNAKDYLTKGVQIDPDFAELYNNLGYTYQLLNQHQQAMGYFKKAIQIDPALGSAYHNLASSYVELGNYEDAIINFKKAIELNPNDPVIYSSLGFVYNSLNKYQEAKRYLLKAKELFQQLGDNRYLEAIDKYLQAIEEKIKKLP
ncbi:MAG: tetratricopeptide repeat protein [Candidatus Omnitrophota bacterium]|nr:tetratricopeptide repeat protein [Candidatus Omnitrophota bacterium]